MAYVLPNSITHIDDYKFKNFTHMTSVRIPNSVTWIGKDAFKNCTSLTSVIIPNSVIELDDRLL